MTREIVTCDKASCMLLLDYLKAEPKCNFCGTEITEENFGIIYNKPIVVSCNSLLCLSEAVDETEEEKGE